MVCSSFYCNKDAENSRTNRVCPLPVCVLSGVGRGGGFGGAGVALTHAVYHTIPIAFTTLLYYNYNELLHRNFTCTEIICVKI